MRRPSGFTVLSVILGFVLAGYVRALLAERPAAGEQGPVVAALNLLVLVLMAVACEALWRVRPWCTRAFGFVAAAVLLRLEAGLVGASTDLLGQAMAVGYTGGLLAIVLVYVRSRAKTLFGPRPVRTSAPRLPLRRGSILPPQVP
ncbi:MAG TPA: hypothetical protein VF541_04715 [Longimicrobium sp.]